MNIGLYNLLVYYFFVFGWMVEIYLLMVKYLILRFFFSVCVLYFDEMYKIDRVNVI